MKKLTTLLSAILIAGATVSQNIPRHEPSYYVQGGLSRLSYTTDLGLSPALSFGLGAGAAYTFSWVRWMGLTTGLELAWYRASLGGAVTERFTLEDTWQKPSDGQPEAGQLGIANRFDRYEEVQNALFLQVPLMAQFYISIPEERVFFIGAGVKPGVALLGRYSASGAGATEVLAQSLSHATPLDVAPFSAEGAGKLDMGLNLAASLEAGVRWAAGKKLWLYTSLYADVGLASVSSPGSAPLYSATAGSAALAPRAVGSALASPHAGGASTLAVGVKLRFALSTEKEVAEDNALASLPKNAAYIRLVVRDAATKQILTSRMDVVDNGTSQHVVDSVATKLADDTYRLLIHRSKDYSVDLYTDEADGASIPALPAAATAASYDPPAAAPVEGASRVTLTVRDTKTKQPLAGIVRVYDQQSASQLLDSASTEDSEGRYTLSVNPRTGYRVNIAVRVPRKVAVPFKSFKKGSKLVMRNLTFPSGKAELSDGSKKNLQGLVEFLQAYPAVHVEVAGHTDNTVAKGVSNKELSKQRAQAVVDYLVSQGVDAGRLDAVGYGHAKPLSKANSAAAREKNRRVEIKILAK